MKFKISCPKCKSENIEMIANTSGVTPMYKCKKCGYKNNLFPQFSQEGEKDNEDEE